MLTVEQTRCKVLFNSSATVKNTHINKVLYSLSVLYLLFDGPLFDGPLFDGLLFDGPLFDDPLVEDAGLLFSNNLNSVPSLRAC